MWYDLFSLVYDRLLEDLYAPFRPAAVEALGVSAGATVVDVPCGTGQSLDGLVQAVGPTGRVLGVDRSRGMLRSAKARVSREGWTNVSLRKADASAIDTVMLETDLGVSHVDGVTCSLGLTAIPQWESTFDKLLSLLRPGGRLVLFDVYASERTRQGRSVELIARADLSRPVWRALETHCDDFQRTVLSRDVSTFGGELYVASGTRR